MTHKGLTLDQPFFVLSCVRIIITGLVACGGPAASVGAYRYFLRFSKWKLKKPLKTGAYYKFY